MSIYEICAIVATLCLVFITVYVVLLLKKANQTLDGLNDTNEQINGIVSHVREAVSLANPLLNTMKDAKKILEQLRGFMGLAKKTKNTEEPLKKKPLKIVKRKKPPTE